MQRALVFLVVVLVAAVAILGLMVADLSSTVEETRIQGSRDARRGGPRRDADSDDSSPRLIRMEEQLERATDENSRLRSDVRKLTIRVSNLAKERAVENAASPPSGTDPIDRVVASTDPSVERARDGEGNFLVSEEDMEYFRAVQTKIDRVRRIDGQARNYERRIEGLASHGDIAMIDPERNAEIAEVLELFVTRNDDLVTRYVRSPGEEILKLSNEERREQLRIAREKYGAEAQKSLAGLVGETDAKTIAERVFTNPWGLRSRNANR